MPARRPRVRRCYRCWLRVRPRPGQRDAARWARARRATAPTRRSAHAGFAGPAIVDPAANGFDPNEIVRDFDWGTTRRLASGRVLREWELDRARQGDRGRARRQVRRLDLQRARPRPDAARREGELLRITFANGSAHPHTIHFHGIHPSCDGRRAGHRRRADRARRQHRLRVRRAARSGCTSTTATPAAGRAHRQGPLRRVHHRPEAGPRRGRRAGDGHERLRHELRPRERDLRRQHDRLRLHGPSRSRSSAASSCGSTWSTSSSTT